MEGVGVVFAVGYAFYDSVFLFVYADESAGETFGGSAYYREVETVFAGGFVGAAADVTDYFESEVLRVGGFAVVLADEGFEAFGETYEADCKGSCFSTSPTLSSIPSLSESSQMPCPIRNG